MRDDLIHDPEGGMPRLLEIMRHRLAVGRLPAAAIERGARARHARL